MLKFLRFVNILYLITHRGIRLHLFICHLYLKACLHNTYFMEFIISPTYPDISLNTHAYSYAYSLYQATTSIQFSHMFTWCLMHVTIGQKNRFDLQQIMVMTRLGNWVVITQMPTHIDYNYLIADTDVLIECCVRSGSIYRRVKCRHTY